MGETIAHTGWIIMIFQLPVAWIFERFKAFPSFIFGLFVVTIGFIFLALANTLSPAFVFLGIFLFAVGEMISSPRIQEYITWLAPKEKAGLYMGSNFLATAIGGLLSGVVYTNWIYAGFEKNGHTEYAWFIMAGHLAVGIIALMLFSRFAGQFKEQEA